jgi:uncharacterized phage protein (TIGR01671 family)
MREIKFRAWDKQTKEMFTINKLSLHPNVGMAMCATCGLHIGVIESIDYSPPMQFTGLLDIKKNPIFEGDIVALDINRGEIDRVNVDRLRAVAEWDESLAAFSFVTANRNEKFQAWTIKRINVIGNIYENPELLTQ